MIVGQSIPQLDKPWRWVDQHTEKMVALGRRQLEVRVLAREAALDAMRECEVGIPADPEEQVDQRPTIVAGDLDVRHPHGSSVPAPAGVNRENAVPRYSGLMLVRAVSLAAVLALTVGVGTASTAASTLYRGSAQRLVPTSTQAGYKDVKVLTGSPTRVTARYTTRGAGGDATLVLGIRVLPTEAAAKASLTTACPGCGPFKQAGRASWRYTLRVDPGVPGRANRATVVAGCRNLRVDATQQPSGASKTAVDGRARRVIDAVISKAISLGMSPSCNAPDGGTTPPETGATYWTEAYAEETLTGKLKLPYCKVAPHDADCRLQEPLSTTKATCRGQDAKPGISTYARFTCDILVGNEARAVRIAVWPASASTFRWQTI